MLTQPENKSNQCEQALANDNESVPTTVGAVIVAGGQSTRMSGQDKTFIDLSGKPLISHTILPFQKSHEITEIVLILPLHSVAKGEELVSQHKFDKVSGVYAGGDTRQESVRIGLKSLNACDWVLIHDGARPCVNRSLISEGIKTAKLKGSAVASVPVTDTIKIISEDKIIQETPPRDRLWASQTPQIFEYRTLIDAHDRAPGSFTDDSSLLEYLGYNITVFEGSYSNIKVTTPVDIPIVESILKSQDE